jgi:hypothetical protein
MACMAVLCGLLAVEEASAGIARDVYVIPRIAENQIVVDGSLDDWAGVPNRIDMTREDRVTYRRALWTGPVDLGGTVHLAWNDQGIFIAAEVTDDILSQTSEDDWGTWRGDHVDLRLYVPQGPSAGSSILYQVGFVPGRFLKGAEKGEGDSLTTVYFPKDAALSSGRVASEVINGGYIIEGFVPFAEIGLKDFIGCNGVLFEVNLSDCDVFPSHQQTMTTYGTRLWDRDPCQFPVLCAGDEGGRAIRRDREFAHFGGFELKPGEERMLEFPGVLVPSAGNIQLVFEARVAGAGERSALPGLLAVELNGRKLIGRRLMPEGGEMPEERKAVVIDDQARMEIRLNEAAAVVFDLDELISLRRNALVFRAVQDEGAGAPMTVSDIRVLFVPDTIEQKSVW